MVHTLGNLWPHAFSRYAEPGRAAGCLLRPRQELREEDDYLRSSKNERQQHKLINTMKLLITRHGHLGTPESPGKILYGSGKPRQGRKEEDDNITPTSAGDIERCRLPIKI